MDKITLPLCDLVVSNNKKGKEILVNELGVKEEKVEVIYNGIDLNKKDT